MTDSARGHGGTPVTSPAGVAGGLYRSYLRERESAWGPFFRRALYYSGLVSAARNLTKGYEIRRDREKWLPLIRKAPQPKFLILCYHRVGLGGVPLYSELNPSLFEAHMQFLKRHYRVLSLDELCRELKNPTSSQPGVVITFDDGYQDLYRHAFPVLRKYQLPAMVYLIAESMDSGAVAWYDRVFLALQLLPAGQFEIDLDKTRSFTLASPLSRFGAALEIIGCLRALPNIRRKECSADLEKRLELPASELQERILIWEQVRAMQNEGISFGSHTVTHPVVSRLDPAELKIELAESKRMLEANLNSPVHHFAFPFGHAEDIGSEALAVLIQSEYVSAATTIPGINLPGTNPFALRRVQIGEEHDLAMFAYTMNQFFLVAEDEHPQRTSRTSSMSVAERPPVAPCAVKGSRHA